MPLPVPPELAELQKQFNESHTAWLASSEGKRQLRTVTDFGKAVRAFGPEAVLGKAGLGGARAALDWLARCPPTLLGLDGGPWLALAELKPKLAQQQLAGALQTLTVGARAMLVAGTVKGADRLPEVLLRVAFGADEISAALRKPFAADPKLPLPEPWPWPVPEKLGKLVLAGQMREFIASFARCGYQAQQERQWTQQIRPIGSVTALQPGRGCGGTSLTVSFSGLGSTPPPAGSDVILAVPARPGCRHFAFSRIAPGLLGAGWRDSGSVTVTLPTDVFTGALGLFLVPPPMPQDGGCLPGGLAEAAAGLQSALADVFGPAGVRTGQVILQLAQHVEAGRQQGLPCATGQPGAPNWLLAGPPVITEFRHVEAGAIHPGDRVTLAIGFENTDAASLAIRPVADSANPHELPPMPFIAARDGQVVLKVPCTRRWEADIVLSATNANGCAGQPVERVLRLRSGFSHWHLGVGRADITDRRPDLGMAGFAYKQQTSSGDLLDDPGGRPLPLYARAFTLRENRPAGDRHELTIVVADLWTCTIRLRRAVIEELNRRHAGRGETFDEKSLMIAGTHTHAAPGGYSDFMLYNLTVRGQDPALLALLANGIANAVDEARRTARPGRLFVHAGPVADCGVNRSMPAFQRNPEAAAGVEPTDREMLLLRFTHDVDNLRTPPRDIGALNWYAIHPTSLGMYNRWISGDNKGWAAMLMERERGGGFVAGFGNAAAGDVSGNYSRDGFGQPVFERPLGGPLPAGMAIPPRLPRGQQLDIDRMMERGRQQAVAARNLFDAATTEVTGRLSVSHAWVDMSNQVIAGQPGARTWPAALGVSFGAGSSEDSIAYATKDGTDIDAGILEGIDQAGFAAGTVAGVSLLGAALAAALPTAPLVVADILRAVVTGTPLAPQSAAVVWPAVAALVFAGPRSAMAAVAASLLLPGELEELDPTLRWTLPSFVDYPAGYLGGHGHKPIMFPVGLAQVARPVAVGDLPVLAPTACPLVPHVLPLQLVRMGAVALAAVPAEFTATAGRRLKATLRSALGPGLRHVAIAGYANGYSGYVTTAEEYGAQHYEGASTLYGEHTLAAYQQAFAALASAAGRPSLPGESRPVAIVQKP